VIALYKWRNAWSDDRDCVVSHFFDAGNLKNAWI